MPELTDQPTYIQQHCSRCDKEQVFLVVGSGYRNICLKCKTFSTKLKGAKRYSVN